MASPTATTREQVWNEFWYTTVHSHILSRAGPDKADGLTIDILKKLQRPSSTTREKLLQAQAEGDEDHVCAILRTCARNAIIDADRHDRAEERYASRYHHAQPEPVKPEAQLERMELSEDLNKALASVPGGAELLMHVEGFNYAEIQHHVGAPTPDAIRKRIARALAILREDPQLQRYSPRPQL